MSAGSPVKVFDAAAHGVPVVISDAANAGPSIDDGMGGECGAPHRRLRRNPPYRAGLGATEDLGVIPGGATPEAFAAAVASLLTNETRHAAAVVGLARFRRKYSQVGREGRRERDMQQREGKRERAKRGKGRVERL